MRSLIKELSWQDIRGNFYKLNPDFAKIIDNLPLKNKHNLYRVRYPYGAHMLHNGVLLLPNVRGEFVPLTDSSISVPLKNAFQGNRFYPIYLCSHNHMEVYFDYPKSYMPISILSPGKLTGLYDLDDTFSSMVPSVWNWYSGIKTLALFCGENQEKIGRRVCKKLALPDKGIIKNDHINLSPILSKLVSNNLFGSNEWYSEVLLFPSSWRVNQSDAAWKPFYSAIKQISWDRSKLWRFRWAWDGLLARCISGNESQLTVAFLKHLMSVACGSLTGYTYANESELPLSAFKTFFHDLIGDSCEFKILSPKSFNYKDSGALRYCPLQPDMILDGVSVDMKQYDLTAEKTNLKNLLANFFSQLSKMDLLPDTPLYNIKNQVEFIFDDIQEDFFNQNYVLLKAK